MAKIITARENKRWDRKGWLLLVTTSVYLYLFVRVLWRVGDEGTLVYAAQLVSEGALPYRDFVEIMGPGTFYWLALFFKIFGAKWLVARGVLLLTGTITTILLYWMTRRLYRGSSDILPAFFYLMVSIPLWPATNHHWDSNLFALFSIGAFFLWQDTGRRWFLAAAGTIAGLTSCFMQQKGFLLFLALLLVLLINGLWTGEKKGRITSNLVIVTAGYSLVGTIVILFFYLAGGLPNLVYATLQLPLSTYHKFNILPYGFGLFEFHWPSWQTILQSVLSPMASRYFSILFLIPFSIILFLPVLLVTFSAITFPNNLNRPKIFNSTTFPYWAAGIALWISELQRMDIQHLTYGSPLLLIVLFYNWEIFGKNKKIIQLLGLFIITISITLFGIFNALIAAGANHKIDTRRGTVYSHHEDAALTFLHTKIQPGEQVFIYPYYPMYYFLANVKNPTRYSVLLYVDGAEAGMKEALNDIKEKNVKYILWDTFVEGPRLKTWFPQYDHPPKERLYLEQYMESHYQIIGLANGFRILQRRDFSEAVN